MRTDGETLCLSGLADDPADLKPGQVRRNAWRYAQGMAKVSVLYTPGGEDWGTPPYVVEVEGSDDELLHGALTRAVGVSCDPVLVVDIDDDGRDEYVLGTLDELTVGQADRFAAGATLHLAVIGVGGGIVPTVVELVLLGLTLVDVVDRTRQGVGVVTRFRHRERRAAAERWLIDGQVELSISLRTLVNEHSRWHLSDVKHAFGLDSRRAAELLRAAGYIETSTTPSTWEDAKD